VEWLKVKALSSSSSIARKKKKQKRKPKIQMQARKTLNNQGNSEQNEKDWSYPNP
jgi:hypothetical protein